jgi:hypothetical protein
VIDYHPPMHRLLGSGVCIVLLACTGQPESDTSASEAGESESESESETSDTGDGDAPLLLSEPTIIHHPKQPMIIDVIVDLAAPATGELVHQTDDDVRVFLLEPAAGESATQLHFRVRGLLPDTQHPLALEVSETQGDRTATWQGSVTSNPPLPGFLPKFQIESLGPDRVDPVWRLFDMTELFSSEPAGVFMVDDEGTTRWYVGDVDDSTDLQDVYQGLHLRPDGTVSFTRRNGAFIIDELGEYVMQIQQEDLGADGGFHHDMTELPNGNFLILGFVFQDIEYPDDGTLHVAGDIIYESTPAGELVWSWNSFDHLDPQRRLADFYGVKIPDPANDIEGYDWTHGNGIVYRADDDTILLSMRHQDWIIAIDHQTGEIRWHLGEEGDFTLVGAEQWFFHQHSPQWQPDGSLLLYDNAVGNPAQPDTEAHSRAVRYVLDLDAMTATQAWHDDDPQFRSPLAGDADRMPGGHILRLDSMYIADDHPVPSSRLRELDPASTPNAVWTLNMPPRKFSYRAVPISRFVGDPE